LAWYETDKEPMVPPPSYLLINADGASHTREADGAKRRRTNSHTIWRKASARKRDLTISSKKNHERGGDVGKEVTIFSTIFTKRKRVVVCSKEKSYLKCQTAIIQHVLKAEKGSG